MKKLFVSTLLLMSACVLAQDLPKIKGSGIVTLKEEVLTEPFDRIDIDGDFEIELQQGSTNQYSIETDDNLIEVVTFQVANNTLTIAGTHRIIKKKRLKIILIVSTIAEIHLNNEARIQSDRLIKGENLLLTAGKGSKFDLDLAYTEAITMELFSDADGAVKVKSQNSKVTLDGRASLKMYVLVDVLESQLKDSSRATLDGAVGSLNGTLSDSAKLNAKDALLTTAALTLSDNSDAYVNVKEAITLYAQDTSTIELYGDPTITVDGLKNRAKILKKD
ncbi:GIN domain-containing protein [Dokdonia ponticola]|uniref:GIN domain-containing protein n=1 Tax=Dokdonia ponticola TaxID=2041041 RepID=A0ABV9HWG2_9FLAO